MALKKPRKPLDDSLAEEFVYGEKNISVPLQGQTELTQPTIKEETSLLEQLYIDNAEPKEATVRFTVDLPESMHRKLSILSAKTGVKKAHIVRKLLEQILQDIKE